MSYRRKLEASGQFVARRAEQAREWMWSEVHESLALTLREDPRIRDRVPELEAAVGEGRIPPAVAAKQLLDLFLEQLL